MYKRQYIYPLKKTPLNLVLDKKFLLDEISKSESYYSDKDIIAFKFFKDENEIDNHIKHIEIENKKLDKVSRMRELENWLNYLNLE